MALDYDKLLSTYPWLIQKDQIAIISPDVDGILCGLLMQYYLGWMVVGFYDTKTLVVNQCYSPRDAVFLDMEILDKHIKSIGHHLIVHNVNKIPYRIKELANCVNPNVLRNYDKVHNFKEKYPFATIHFLLLILSASRKIKKLTISDGALSLLYYVNGTFKNVLNYPENCKSWLNYLNASAVNPWLYSKLAGVSIRKLTHLLMSIFKKFKETSKGIKGKGDKIAIKSTTNIEHYLQHAQELVKFISECTGWTYNPTKWKMYNFNKKELNKHIENLSLKSYKRIAEDRETLSLAITANNRIEYTQGQLL